MGGTMWNRGSMGHLARAGLLAGLLAVTPRAACAQDIVACVGSAEQSPGGDCQGLACDLVEETFAVALLALDGLVASFGPTVPSTQLCLLPGVGGPADPHTESVVVDNRGARLGEPLQLELLGRPLCPAVDSPASQPVLELVTDGEASLVGLSVDVRPTGPCAAGPRPGLSVWGGGTVLAGRHVEGTVEYAVANGLSGAPVTLTVPVSVLNGGTGAAVWTRGSTTLDRTEIIGFSNGPGDAASAVLWAEGPTATLDLLGATLHGNRVLASPTARNLLRGRVGVVRTSSLGADPPVRR